MLMRNCYSNSNSSKYPKNKYFQCLSNIKYPANMQSIIGLWDFQMCSVVFHLDVDSAFCVFIIMFLGAVTYHRLKYIYACQC